MMKIMLRNQPRLALILLPLWLVAWAGSAVSQEATEEGTTPEAQQILVEENLLHYPDDSITEQLEGRRVAIASDGTYVGVASSGADPSVEVLILSEKRVEKKLSLQPPLIADSFNLFTFSFADAGETCVLGGLIQHHVFRKKELVGSFSFVSRMADIRGDELLWSLEADAPPSHIKIDEDPPQLVISDLKERTLYEDDCQVLRRVELQGLDRDDGFSVIAKEVLARYRDDGKIWTVGTYSGIIQLLSRTGKVLDEKTVEAESEPVDSEGLEAELLDSVGRSLTDPDPDIVVLTPSQNPIVRTTAVLGRDLYILPTKYSSDHGVLIVLDSLDRMRFFRLPNALLEAKGIAVTEEAIWFDNPLCWIDLHDLEMLVLQEEQKENQEPGLT